MPQLLAPLYTESKWEDTVWSLAYDLQAGPLKGTCTEMWRTALWQLSPKTAAASHCPDLMY